MVLAYLPEGLDACREDAGEGIQDAAGVDNNEDDRDDHRCQHDSEAGTDFNHLPKPEAVVTLNRPEQVECGENPPRIPVEKVLDIAFLVSVSGRRDWRAAD